jgi:hypothetical protein
MTSFSRGLAAAVLLVACAAPPASAATVSVRVEGAQKTLVPLTRVQPSSSVVVDKRSEGGTTCDGSSGGGALELAAKGDWGGRSDAQGQRVERILGETYLLGAEFAGRFWSLYVNNVPADFGLCSYTPQEGDEILLAAACGGATTGCFSGDPLDLRAPATAAPGEPASVSVDEYTSDFTGAHPTAARAPSSGATVTGGGQTATTDAQGRATLAFAERGPVDLVTTKGGRIRDEATICVTDGADGFCGTTKPGEPAPQAAPCATTGHDGLCGTRDSTAPEARVGAVRDGQTFASGRGPRTLSGKVAADASGLLMVKLRLTRNDGSRCSYYSGKHERFVAARCGATQGKWFSIGDRADWSYLLPSALPRGRYVLDVNAIDRSFNRDDARRRGSNRVVFLVR